MNCDRCKLTLPPGAAHVNEEGCIAALRAALDLVLSCRLCGDEVKLSLCTPCGAKAFAQGKFSDLASRAGSSILQSFLGGGAAPDEEQSDGKKRFKP